MNRSLDITPAWSPDGKAIAYTSYRTGFPDIFVQSHLRAARRTRSRRTARSDKQNFLPAWSPDGIEARVHVEPRRQPGNLRDEPRRQRTCAGSRTIPKIDVTPTWSPTGNQIAFTSDRSGSPQIWIMDADGSEPRQDHQRVVVRPSDVVAGAVQRDRLRRADRRPASTSRSSTSRTAGRRTITDGIGSNESPAFSPNGRHIAFTSTRAGKEQIFIIDRDGKDLHQVTKTGHEPVSELVAIASAGCYGVLRGSTRLTRFYGFDGFCRF